MLETSNLTRKYTPICSFRNYTFQCLSPVSFPDVNIFLLKNSGFCPKNYLHSKQQCEIFVRDFLVLFCSFVRQKVTITEDITFADSLSGIQPPECCTPLSPKNFQIYKKWPSTVFCFSKSMVYWGYEINKTKFFCQIFIISILEVCDVTELKKNPKTHEN